MITTVDGYMVDGCMRCKFGGTPDCKVNLWREVLEELRRVVLLSGLTEEVKWGVPCYTDKGKNILLLSAFKEYACISFLKGALLNDDQHILIQQGAQTQTARIIKFYTVAEVRAVEEVIQDYIREAVENERLGKKIEIKKEKIVLPELLIEAFEKDLIFKEAFNKLSPSKQRGYLILLLNAKQVSTQLSRIEKIKLEIVK